MCPTEPDATSPDAAGPPGSRADRPDASWRWALDASGAGTWTWDALSDVTRWDERFLALYDIPPGAPHHAETWMARLHPDDRPRIRARIEAMRASSGDNQWSEVFRHRAADGRERWHHGIGQAYRDATGTLTAMAGIVIDITARIEAEREADARLALAMEAADFGSYEYRPQTATVIWDARMRSIWGVSEHEVLSRGSLLERVHADDRARVAALFEEALAPAHNGRFDAEYRIVRPDGSIRWTSSCGRVDFEGDAAARRPIRVVGIERDITARKQADEVLQAALEAMTDAVFISDAAGRFVLINEAFATFHRFPSRAACALTLQEYPGFLDVYSPTGELVPLDQWAVPRALRGETAVNQEYHLHRKDTGDRWIGSYNLAPVRDASGAVAGSVVIGRDITEQKRADAVLAELRERQSFLLRLGDALRPLTDAAAVQDTATRLLGEHLRVNRVHYAEVDGDDFVVRSAYATGVEPLRGRYPIEPIDTMPIDRLQQTLAVDDVDTDPRLSDAQRARMRAVHIRAGVRLTLVRAGRVVAGAAVNQVTPRTWTATELALIEQVAERIYHEGERVRAEHLARQAAKRDAFALQLSDALRVATDPRAIKTMAARALGEFLGASRVLFAEAFEQREAVVVADWTRGVTSLVGSHLPAIPDGPATVTTPEPAPMIVEDAAREPRLDASARAAWSEAAVAAAVNVPRWRNGRWVGTFAVHSDTPRNWTPSDVVVIQDTAERAAQAVERAQAALALQSVQAALQVSEARYRGLAEQIDDGIFVADSQGRYVDANHAACEMMGYTLPELRALSVQALLADEELPKLAGQLAELSSGKTVRNTWVFKRKDGSTFAGELVGRQLPDGRLQGVLRDVTERSKVAEAVRTLEAVHREDSDVLHTLLTTAAQGILSVTEDGIIRSVNPALESMLGWDWTELVGRRHDELIPAALRERHAAAQASYWAAPRARAMGNGLELAALRKDGTLLPVEISLAPIETSHGRLVFAFVSDISARRRHDDERAVHTRELAQQADLLRRLASELTLSEQQTREELATVLHNHLQQVLFSARMRLQRLARRIQTAGDADSELMRQAGQDVDEAIRTTRAFVAELSPPMLHQEGLAAALAWLQGWAQDKYGLSIALTADPQANPEARDVRTLVFESVKELVFNAVKHAQVDRIAVELGLTSAGDVRIAVADAGTGFDPADLLAVGRTRGTGFGLLAIRERLASLGGRLDIETAPGRGARFTLTVPRGPAPTQTATTGASTDASVATPPAGATASTGHPLRIVLADDHALVRDGLRQLLVDHPGLHVVGEAGDGIEAVALVHALRPDVVIMDVAMPRMDGIEATRRIRAASPGIVVLGLSTQERIGGRHAIEDAGAADYFAKGDDAQRLLERLLAIHASRARTVAPDAAPGGATP